MINLVLLVVGMKHLMKMKRCFCLIRLQRGRER